MLLPASPRRVATHALLFVGLALVPSGPAIAQASDTSTKTTPKDPGAAVSFTHEGCTPVAGVCRAAYNLSLADGETFAIAIRRTLPNDFTYEVAGIPAAPSKRDVKEAPDYRDTVLHQVHDRKYGGYIVNIRKKEKASLPDATLIIGVRTAEWTVAVAGGFPVSTLTDKQFSLRDTTVGGETQYLVRREKDHEDRVALSTATFVHLRRTGWNWWRTRAEVGLSFGLGVSSNTTYFVGPSFLFGNAGALTLGAVFGSRADLPNGVNVNALTRNANALTNPTRRNGTGFFVGFSYSFLGNTSLLEKPFKGTEAPAKGDTSGGSGKGSAKGSIEVVQDRLAKGDSVTFRLHLAKGDGGKEDLVSGDYPVYPLAAADSALVQLPATVKLTATSKDAAEGTLVGKMRKAPGGAVLHIVVNGKGYRKEFVTESLTSR